MRRGIAAVGLAAVVLSGCGNTVTPPPAPTSVPQTPATSSTTVTTSAAATASPTASGYTFPYQPMWPFAGQDDADRWLGEGRPAGNDLWHADPRATALKFTREYLAFTDLDRTTTLTEQPREAWVGVGQADPRGTDVTVARLHLARFGPAADAPWVVVGSEDTELTLEKPAYGSPVQPVVEVGGLISGVDESLLVQARQLSALVGEFCCVPAGGERAPWTASVPIAPRGPGVVTVARLHLARFGPAADAPWVVVGSEDTELTLEKPAYGSPVQPVVEVGGLISGVDESLLVQARQLSALVGEFCCVPAGGERAPWTASVPIAPRGPGVVTVVVSTGGHYANIERFAVTALRAN